MIRESLKKEIEYVIESTHHSAEVEFVRPFDQMQRFIYNVTNSCFPLGDFLNDYIRLFRGGKIDERMYKSAVNDLYLIALQFTNYYEGWKHLKGD